jgi:hypothetical protein
MYSLALIIFEVSEKKAFEHFPIVFYSNIKWKMVATAGLSLTLDPMGKCSSAFKKLEVCRGPSNEHSCTVWL